MTEIKTNLSIQRELKIIAVIVTAIIACIFILGLAVLPYAWTLQQLQAWGQTPVDVLHSLSDSTYVYIAFMASSIIAYIQLPITGIALGVVKTITPSPVTRRSLFAMTVLLSAPVWGSLLIVQVFSLLPH